MAKLKKDLSKEAEEWFIAAIGFMPTEEELEELFDREPGWAKLIHHILDPQKDYQDYNLERKRKEA